MLWIQCFVNISDQVHTKISVMQVLTSFPSDENIVDEVLACCVEVGEGISLGVGQ